MSFRSQSGRAVLLTGLASSLLAVAPVALRAQTQFVVDPDSALSMTLPKDWSPSTFGTPAATVEMINGREDAFLVIIVESKEDFFGWNMTRFMYITMAQSLAELEFPQVSSLEEGQVDGRDAVFATVLGATGGQRFKYRRVAIDAPDHWVQVVFGGFASGFAANEPAFSAALESIDLLPNEPVAQRPH